MTARHKRERQLNSTESASAKVTDARRLKQAQKLAENITEFYPLRTWAQWTSRQKHGWWSHVKDGHWTQIKFTQADLEELRLVWRRCEDERLFDKQVLVGLDEIEKAAGLLVASVRNLREQLRRKAKASQLHKQARQI